MLIVSAAIALPPMRLLAAAEPAELARPAPPFRVPDSDNRVHQLSDYRGKAVVLEWTSPSCPFVRAQYQSGVMQEVQQMALKQGAVWFSVLSTHPSRGDYLPPDQAAKFQHQRGAASTALLIDSEGSMGRAYGAAVTPHIFIIGTDGNLAYAGGPGDKATMDPHEVRTSRSFIRAALLDLAANRPVSTPSSPPFGCAIAYRG